MKERVLITGIHGFLGAELANVLSSKFEVYGTYFSSSPSESIHKTGCCDLRKLSEVKSALDRVKPHRVFHLAALSDPNICDREAKLSEELNFQASTQLASLCGERKITLIFTSTDLVFDGRKGNYSEEDDVNPLSRYAEHKVMAEESMLDNPFANICRMPLMYSTNDNKRSMVHVIKEKVKNKEPLTLFTDEFRSALHINCASKALMKASVLNEAVLHLGGPQRQSRYEMGVQIAEVYGLSQKWIRPCLQKDLQMPAKRPADVSLNSAKALSLGVIPRSLLENLLV
ncbi:SDR family oxidoreductase [Lentisphaera marina]|uniref:SDR family oxidoreductase n=1 Tax=Lentisphaera marina TaxID=1111041 RepID=UPI002366A41A|nr:SDR family oxidoreductase [Lentisphaera marina]MDD7984133.1 SDR family oxidoreductase [Lentisphaera marina]